MEGLVVLDRTKVLIHRANNGRRYLLRLRCSRQNDLHAPTAKMKDTQNLIAGSTPEQKNGSILIGGGRHLAIGVFISSSGFVRELQLHLIWHFHSNSRDMVVLHWIMNAVATTGYTLPPRIVPSNAMLSIANNLLKSVTMKILTRPEPKAFYVIRRISDQDWYWHLHLKRL